MRMRLSPLMRVGDDLGVKLSPEYYDPKSSSMAKYSSTQSTSYSYNQPSARELTVRSGSGWKAAFGVKSSSAPPTRSGATTAAEDEAARVLHACVDDIWTIWTDPIVKEVLKKRKVRLQEMSGLCVYVHLSRPPFVS